MFSKGESPMKKSLLFYVLLLFSFSVLSAQSVTVKNPAANDNWIKGSTQTITWMKSGTMPGTVRISLRNAADMSEALLISAGASNTGSFAWQIPTQIADGSYKIRIKVKDTDIMDNSDTFTIGSSSGGMKVDYDTVRKMGAKLIKFSIDFLKPAWGEIHQQSETMIIQFKANTGPADGSGDGFDLDLYNETGTAVVTDIHSGAVAQTSPGIYNFEWNIPRMDFVPDGKYTIRAKSWLRKIVGLSAPFQLRIPGTEEKVTINARADGTWRAKRSSDTPMTEEAVRSEYPVRPGEAQVGWHNDCGNSCSDYTGIIFRGRLQFGLGYVKSKASRFRRATLRLKQAYFGHRSNVGGIKWTIGKVLILNAPWADFFDTPSTFLKEVPTNLAAEWTCDVTDVVRDWLTGARPNHGLLLTAHSEDWLRVERQWADSYYTGSLELVFFKPVY